MNPSEKRKESDCAGFIHWPPLWIGTRPAEHGADLTTALMNAEAFSGEITCGVRLRVSKQALFIFDFTNWEPASFALTKSPFQNWEERIFARMRFMNFFLACFYTSMIRVEKMTSEKLYIDYTTYLAARNFSLNPYHMQSESRQSSVFRDAEEYQRNIGLHLKAVSENILQTAVEMANTAIAGRFDEAITLADMLLHAFSLHQSGKYEASHLTAWTIAEKCLNELWNIYLQELNMQHAEPEPEGKFINSARKGKLTGRDFTASIITEVLSFSDKISFDTYKLTSRVRKKRNDWLHNLGAIGQLDAAEAIGLAQDMLRKAGILNVAVPFHVIKSIPLAISSE